MIDADRDAFLRAIAAAPQDDTRRLAFADFLDDRGTAADRETAAFIRADVELARTDEADPGYPALLARARRSGVLTRKERVPWLDFVPGAKVAFRRGLVGAVWLDPVTHAGQAAADWSRVPVEHLAWLPKEHDGARGWGAALGASLAARPELDRLASLDVTAPAAFAEPLLTDPARLAALRALHFGHFWVHDDDGGAEHRRRLALAEGMKLPALDSLRVGGAWPPDEWTAFVAAAGGRLSRLHLDATSGDRDWYDSDTDWGAPVRNRPLTYGVAWLDLSSLHSFGTTDTVWDVGDRAATERAVMSAPDYGWEIDLASWPALRRLHVEVSNDGDGLGELSHRPDAGRLEWFSSTACYSDDTDRFGAGTQLRNLRRLSVHDSGSKYLRGDYCRRLHRLEWGNSYRDVDTAALLAADLPELRWLTLRGCDKAHVLDPLPTATNMPNLCTLVLADAPPEEEADVLNALLARLATARGMPHLSLVGVGRRPRDWWVLRDGRAVPVHPGVEPVWRDWWEPDPTDAWF